MEMLDLIGIGVGPFNLSLAALAQPTPLRTMFFEKEAGFTWHPGLLLPNSRLQVSPLKDCVTLADPTSPYSFLNYLSVHGRLYSFINRRQTTTSRSEFTQYYQWVARQLPNLRFGEEVTDIANIEKGYRVTTTKDRYLARAVAIGVGIVPKIPECARPWLGKDVYHVANYLHRLPIGIGERVMVVGGGQSGAEIIEHLLGNPAIGKITWVTSRANLFTMDDSAFVNESYMPSYSLRFHALPLKERRSIVENEKLTSDGISSELSNCIYKMVYERSASGNIDDIIQLLPAVVMEDLFPEDLSPNVQCWHALLASHNTGQRRAVAVDRIILATGFQPRTLPFIDTLLASACMEDGLPVVRDDYAVKFKDNISGSVYLQNRTLVQNGLQSVNLSLVAFRNSRIINSILGQEYYTYVPDRHFLKSLGDLSDEEAQQNRTIPPQRNSSAPDSVAPRASVAISEDP
ncbi:lysine N(6)-hydroxylase/L-ornithine N(5)-oxygenase family protein [Mesorhizobium amorphae]|uniref:Oxygenase n=1 Tax=Mesorhizobium amorphae CCNWGS0123 TaxID=1082933 RepID=G6YIB0_9HYPH|nr:SidA/IucD/PvdA family monooxygenase [Mesorhizobium amorphae]EHH06291.1 oxygenase [Mesorhizobium amorphae CCNWGS0123]